MVEIKNRSPNNPKLYASIAHEINNPLTIMTGYAELLQVLASAKNLDREKIKVYAKKIIDTSKRVSNIVNGLKQMAAGSTDTSVTDFDLGSIIKDAVGLSTHITKNNSVDINLELPENIMIEGWSWQIVQVIFNLIKNSCEAFIRKDDRKIVISVFKEKETILIKYQDNGPGIPKKLQKNIFFPFFSTKNRGSGMGLALVRQFVSNHGGSIRYQKLGSMSEFHINLPIKIPDNLKGQYSEEDLLGNDSFLSTRSIEIESVGQGLPENTPAPEKLDLKVLVVDDEVEILEIVKMSLEPLVSNVYVFSSPLEALKAARTEKYDILITDVVMPEMSGYDLIRELKKSNFSGKFLVISGSATNFPNDFESIGADSIFQKPINFQALKKRILKFQAIATSKIEDNRKHERHGLDTEFSGSISVGTRDGLKGIVQDISKEGFQIKLQGQVNFSIKTLINFNLYAQLAKENFLHKGLGEVCWSSFSSEANETSIGIRILKLNSPEGSSFIRMLNLIRTE